MQLFLFLNDLAGRWPLLDGLARAVYVGALPALGTLLLAQLLLLPARGGVSRSKTALALVLAVGLGALIVWGFACAASAWHLGNLSPRPLMTRRVNLLVVEPQDNSFPCVEVLLAAIVAGASWRLNRRVGSVSWAIVFLLGLTRMFCGDNYFADVFLGAALGVGAFWLLAAGCERHLAWLARLRLVTLRAAPLALTLAVCIGMALFSPRFEGKFGLGATASAAPNVSVAPPGSAQAEGEGLGQFPGEGRAEELALAKRSTLFLPSVEAYLRGKLTPLARPFALLDVEVAPVKAGRTSYRCAAIRFQVPAEEAGVRRLVAVRAARLVQMAFALDSQLQNVDIVAVALDKGRGLDASLVTFAGDEVPVFTASVQRRNLLLPPPAPAWLNAPGLEGGTWLRARSRLYINDRALPNVPAPTPTPAPTAFAAPTATPLSP